MSEENVEENLQLPPQPSKLFHNPKVRLKAALEILEAFTKKNSRDSFDEGTFKHEAGLSKIMGFAKNFLVKTFSSSMTREKKENEKKTLETNLLNALDDVKRFHPIICNKQSGDTENLAKQTLVAIRNYNTVLSEESKPDFGWHERLLKSLIRKNSNSLSNKHSVTECHHLNRPEKICSLLANQKTFVDLSERELDAFHMKAISLIKDQPVLFPSIRDTMKTIRQTPIYPISDSEQQSEDLSSPAIITLEQTLSPFPGEMVILRGSFKRDPASLAPSMPINGSFEMTTESIQTGFPYPMQHNGWALGEAAMPPFPLRPQHCRILMEILHKKERIATAFLNKTPLLEKSRKLYLLRNETARAHKDEFLNLHSRLIKALLNCAPKNLIHLQIHETAHHFFSWLEIQEDPILALGNFHKQTTLLYIEEPSNRLKECWMNETEKGLFVQDSKQRFKVSKEIILEEIKTADSKVLSLTRDPSVASFMVLYGKILGHSCATLFLQYFSESLECAPPQLSNFERTLQTAALIQQEEFIHEMEEHPPTHFNFSKLRDSLKRDIGLFETKNLIHPLCAQLEKYYISRFVKR